MIEPIEWCWERGVNKELWLDIVSFLKFPNSKKLDITFIMQR